MTKYHFAGSASKPLESIDLIEDDDLQIRFGAINLDDVPDTIDLSADDDDSGRELTPGEIKRYQTKSRNVAPSSVVPPGYQKTNSATTDIGVVIHAGDSVELQDGDFLRIKLIMKHTFTREVMIRGILLRRTDGVNKYFKRNLNELCVIVQAPDDMDEAGNPPLDEYLVDHPISAIIQIRQIIFTNMAFPALSFHHSGRFYNSEVEVEEQAELVVRWKRLELFSLRNHRVKAGAAMQLTEAEADPGRSVPDVARWARWLEKDSVLNPRAVTAAQTAAAKHRHSSSKSVKMERPTSDFVDLTLDEPEYSNKRKRSQEPIDIPDDSDGEVTTVEEQDEILRDIKKRFNRDGKLMERSESVSTITRHTTVIKAKSSSSRGRHDSLSPVSDEVEYSFGDIFAGAGGMSRGAQLAGLRVTFLLDHWADACRTLRLNFPGARVLEQDIFSFCTSVEAAPWMRVAVLHISFPCQTYSAAHIRQVGTCPNDDANEAAGYSVAPILKLTRPRVVTFEQTEGLFTRHPDSFAALIEQLTAMQYNARWRVIQCDRYGNVQPRKRLFIIASCPGEPLPPFPKPTHGHEPGLQRPVTIADRLNLMRPGMDSHDLHMRKFGNRSGAPYNPNRPLRQCITTGGGEGDLHPSGERSFTMRELACLAGFPAHHKFAISRAMGVIRRQIGNAVPSMVGKTIFEEIIESMREFDKVVAGWQPEYIELD